VQYLDIRYSTRLAEAGITPSVGSKGDSYDKTMTSYCTPCLCRDGKAVPERRSLSFDESGVAGGGWVEESDVLVVGLV
jgi:putative transposase